MSQLYIIELIGVLTGLGATVALDIFKGFHSFSMLVFFADLSLMEFQVRYLALFLLFSVIDGFKCFWVGSLHKNIQLMLKFLMDPFLILYFLYYD